MSPGFFFWRRQCQLSGLLGGAGITEGRLQRILRQGADVGDLLQPFAVSDPHPAAVDLNHRLFAQALDDPREGFGLDRQPRSHDLLGHGQFELVSVCRGQVDQVGSYATGGAVQADFIDLAQQAAQALTHIAEQQEAGVDRALEHARKITGVDTDHLGRPERLRANRVTRPLEEHQCLRKGALGHHHLDHLLVTRGRQPEELYLPAGHQIEAFGRVALLEQRLTVVQSDTHGKPGHTFQLGFRQTGKQ